jgi:hypothetical protein
MLPATKMTSRNLEPTRLIRCSPKMAHTSAPDAFASALAFAVDMPEPAKSWNRDNWPAEG